MRKGPIAERKPEKMTRLEQQGCDRDSSPVSVNRERVPVGEEMDQLNVSSRNLLVTANTLVLFATRGRPRFGAVSALKTKRATHRFGQAETVEERRPHNHGRVA
jgi:hypothetical protein